MSFFMCGSKLAALIAVCMLVSCIPMAVFAAPAAVTAGDTATETVADNAYLAEATQTERKGANGRVYTSTTYKPKVTPHQFRHAYASMLDDAGIDETAAKTILGHSSIVVTKDIYTHLRDQKRQRIGGALNEYIKKNTSENGVKK